MFLYSLVNEKTNWKSIGFFEYKTRFEKEKKTNIANLILKPI
jgi:hypothetical protein